MQAMHKKRVLALLSGTSLIAVLIFLLWKIILGPSSLGWAIPVLVSIPVIVGATVGACVRPGTKLDASWCIGMLVWGLIFLVIFIVTITLLHQTSQAPGPPPGIDGPMGYGAGAAYAWIGLIVFEVVYGMCAPLFFLLGLVITHPRRER